MAHNRTSLVAPLFADDEFEIRSHVEEFRERTCTVDMKRMVCVDRRSHASTPWPQAIIDLFFEAHE
jgi:acyl-CoA thioesterase FadM